VCDAAKCAVHVSRMSVAPEKAHLIQPLGVTIAQCLVSEETNPFGAFKQGAAVGFIALEDARVMPDLHGSIIQDCLLIWQVMVDHKHERQGIGSAMIDFAKSYAALVGLSGVALATLDKSVHTPLPFYERHGFKPTGRRIKDDDDDLLELIWQAA